MSRTGPRGLRGLLAGALMLAALPALAADDFPRLGGVPLGGVRVDVGPLLALGAGAQAEALRADLTAAMRRHFADRIGGSGPVLVVRITGLSLRPFAGNDFGRGANDGGGQNDYLDGVALLVSPRGEIIGSQPQLTAIPSSYGGAWYDPASERRRVTVAADIYAAWLRRRLPLD